MTLVRISNRYPSLMDRFFGPELFNWSNHNFSSTDTTIPSVNIKESNEDFEVEVAAPGLTKNYFKIELNHDVLTISSEKENEREDCFGGGTAGFWKIHLLCPPRDSASIE